MAESKFDRDEIEKLRRQAASKHHNVDYDLLQTKRDLIRSARADSLEVFQAKVKAYGIDLASAQGESIMEAYWAIRREIQR